MNMLLQHDKKLRAAKPYIDALAEPAQAYCKLFAHRTTIHERNRILACACMSEIGRQSQGGQDVSDHNAPAPGMKLQEAPSELGPGHIVPTSFKAAIIVYIASLAEQIFFVCKHKEHFSKYAQKQTKNLLENYKSVSQVLHEYRDTFNHPEDRGGITICIAEDWQPILAMRDIQAELDALLLSFRAKMNEEIDNIMDMLGTKLWSPFQATIHRKVLRRMNIYRDVNSAAMHLRTLTLLEQNHPSEACADSDFYSQFCNYARTHDFAASLIEIGSALVHARQECKFWTITNIQTISDRYVMEPAYGTADSKLANYVEHYKLAAAWLNMVLNIEYVNAYYMEREGVMPSAITDNTRIGVIATGFQLLIRHIQLYDFNSRDCTKNASDNNDASKRLYQLMNWLRNIAAHGPKSIGELYDSDYYHGELSIRRLEKKKNQKPREHFDWLAEVRFACGKLDKFYQLACSGKCCIKYPTKRSRKDASPCT